MLREDEIAIEARSRLARQGWNLEGLIAKTCDQRNVRAADLMKKCRENDVSKAKAIVCYWGTQKLGLTAREIAARLAISQPAVSRWVKNGRELADSEQILPEFEELSY